MGTQSSGDGLGAAECGARGEDQLRPVGCWRVAGGGGSGGGGPVARRTNAAGGEGLEGRRSCAQPLASCHGEGLGWMPEGSPTSWREGKRSCAVFRRCPSV